MALTAAERHAKLARKAQRRKEQLKAKAKLAATPAGEKPPRPGLAVRVDDRKVDRARLAQLRGKMAQ